MTAGWGVGGPQQPEGPQADERPISSYQYMIYSAGPDGETMDGCDTVEEMTQIISEMIADPTVTSWVCYQKLQVS